MRVGVSLVALATERTSGLERYSVELVRALRQLREPDLELVVYAHAWADRAIGGGARVVPAKLPRPIAVELWLAASARADGLDLLHSTAFATPALSRVPAVLTLHDLVPWVMPETMSRGQRHYFRPAQDRLMRSRNLAGVVTDAECTAHEIQERFGWRGPIISARAGLTPAPGPASVAVRRSGVRLLTVGTLEPRKGMSVVQGCLAELKRRGVDATWVIVGRRGWGTEPPDDVIELGAVSDGELFEQYALADVLVAPSLLEGFDLPVLEALARGTAVVASDIPVHREHFGAVARLARPGDPVDTARMVMHALREDLTAAAAERRRTHASTFTWERTAADVVALWRQAHVLSRSP